jgi:hypothetical protein
MKTGIQVINLNCLYAIRYCNGVTEINLVFAGIRGIKKYIEYYYYLLEIDYYY